MNDMHQVRMIQHTIVIKVVNGEHIGQFYMTFSLFKNFENSFFMISLP